MAEVTLSIGGRAHIVACRDGEEARVRMLGEMLDERWPAAEPRGGRAQRRARDAVRRADAGRRLDEAEPARRPAPRSARPRSTRIAERLEALADALEQPPRAPR